jgi:hypothetical protein
VSDPSGLTRCKEISCPCLPDAIGAQLSGGSGSASGSGSGGTSGSAALPVCPNGITHVPGAGGGSGNGGNRGNGNSGLQTGGCDVAAARPTAASLGAPLLFLLVSLVVVGRRRLSARRSSVR